MTFFSAFGLFFKKWDVKGSDNQEIKDLLKYLRDSDWVYGSLKGWYEGVCASSTNNALESTNHSIKLVIRTRLSLGHFLSAITKIFRRLDNCITFADIPLPGFRTPK